MSRRKNWVREGKKLFGKYILLCLTSSTGMYEKLRINIIVIKVPKLLQIGEVSIHVNSASAKAFMEF